MIGDPVWSHLPALDRRLPLNGVQRRRIRQTTRRALGWHGWFVIAHVGAMGVRQSLEDLAPALRHLAGVQPDVLISFLGEGGRRPALVQATSGLGNVEIRDPVPEQHRLAVLLAADLLLLSERGEGGGPTLGDYLPSGRPILAVADPGGAAAREIEYSGAGVIVPPGDPFAFTARVSGLRSDPDSRTRFGDAGMRYAERRPAPQGA
ncbi:MAG: glycosyltransferase [Kineosporiaceae bacterium]